jgi:hypothetical protein
LTKEEILEMELRRELDFLVAKIVFNYDICENKNHRINASGWCKKCQKEQSRFYSLYIEEAWRVVEKMFHIPCSDGDCYQFNLTGFHGAFLAVFEHHLYADEEPWNKYEHFEGREKTAPGAICKAALLATLNEKKEG